MARCLTTLEGRGASRPIGCADGAPQRTPKPAPAIVGAQVDQPHFATLKPRASKREGLAAIHGIGPWTVESVALNAITDKQ
jgi:hypothetical protein